MDDTGVEGTNFSASRPDSTMPRSSVQRSSKLSSAVLQIQAKGWADCKAGDHHRASRRRSYSLLIRTTLIFGAGRLRIGCLGIYLPYFLSSTHLSAARLAVRPSKSARNKPQTQILTMHCVAPRRRHHQRFIASEDQWWANWQIKNDSIFSVT